MGTVVVKFRKKLPQPTQIRTVVILKVINLLEMQIWTISSLQAKLFVTDPVAIIILPTPEPWHIDIGVGPVVRGPFKSLSLLEGPISKGLRKTSLLTWFSRLTDISLRDSSLKYRIHTMLFGDQDKRPGVKTLKFLF